MAIRWAVANGDNNQTATFNDGATLGLPTSDDDVFTNGFTVNMVANATYKSLNNTARARDIATPQMTSNNTPSPVVVSQTSTFTGSAWNYFDRNTGTISNSGTQGSNTIKVDFGLGNAPVIDGYSIVPGSNGRGPNTWTFQGSNDDSNWTTINSVSGQSGSATYSVSSVGNTTGYRYYRIAISSYNGSGGGEIAEIELYQRFTAALAAGGSFNFNTGGVTTSIIGTTPLSINAAAAAVLLSITAATGTVSLNFTSIVSHTANSSNTTLISHSGACNLTISGTQYVGTSLALQFARIIVKTSSGTLTVSGNLIGASNGGGPGSNDIINSSAGSTVLVGNAVGGSGASGNRAIVQTGGTLSITGSVTGGSASANNIGIIFSGTSISVTGTVTGGGAAAAIDSTVAVNVIGNVVAGVASAITSTSNMNIDVTGTITASATAVAISSTGASASVNVAGNLQNTNGYQAVFCRQLFISNSTTTQYRFFTNGGQDRTLYSADTLPGSPNAADVRFGTTYGAGGSLTGTLRVPAASNVLSGVLVDDTTGTYSTTPAAIAAEVWSYATRGLTESPDVPTAAEISTQVWTDQPERLKNVATVETTGSQITALT